MDQDSRVLEADTDPIMGEQEQQEQPDPVIDWQAAQLNVGCEGASFRKFVVLFREEAEVHLSSIRDSLAASDHAELRRAAHTLKSAADLFAARPLFTQALELEQRAAGDEDADDRTIDQLVESVEREWGNLGTELSRFLAVSGASGEDWEST